ncbi:HTTM domain-containing protein [Mycolicibacterium vanbaalenii]|uniref:HTTM domain-containing protein n=1 Tax=Mycolicibacterium vanbaalenii TaxID=110539 RepID=UPI0023BA49DE|nr:HTTM domain-containing protein [Mycolicibacterium vanbaalenii]
MIPAIKSRLNRWLLDSPVSEYDLSCYRIIYALFVLVTLWRADYAASLPPVAFDPPDGPFAVLTGSPSLLTIWALQAFLCFSLAALAIGWHARFAALIVAILQIALYGIGYSYGKIDHTILVAVVPLLLLFSSWASHYSVDSYQRPQASSGHSWALRSLAVAIGAALLSAGLAKVLGGWLLWDTQATFGYFVLTKDVFNSSLETTGYLQSMSNPVAWEILDYVTVLLECGIIAAALSWRTFYVGISLLATFHLFIFLTLGILFPYNLPAYAAFLPWARGLAWVPVWAKNNMASRLARSLLLRLSICTIVSLLALGLAWVRPPWLVPGIYLGAVCLGSALGFAYLVKSAWCLLRSHAIYRSA